MKINRGLLKRFINKLNFLLPIFILIVFVMFIIPFLKIGTPKFVSLKDNMEIKNTNYFFKITMHKRSDGIQIVNLDLNRSNDNYTFNVGESPFEFFPDYSLIITRNKKYILLSSSSFGTRGGDVYAVIDINDLEPKWASNSSRYNGIHSCFMPKILFNKLIFIGNLDNKCDFLPFPSYKMEIIKLN